MCIRFAILHSVNLIKLAFEVTIHGRRKNVHIKYFELLKNIDTISKVCKKKSVIKSMTLFR